jgi:hypothetical protein
MNGKKYFFRFCVLLTAVFLTSCISLQDRNMTGKDLDELTVLGSVGTEFLSWQPLHIHITPLIKYSAYKKLLTIARKKYAGQYDASLLDIKNIVMEGTLSGLQWDPLTTLGWYVNDWQNVYAHGDVVINSTASRRIVTAASRGIDGAIYRAAEKFVNELADSAIVSVLNVSVATEDDARFIIEELEFRLEYLNAGFTIVDRRGLAQIRSEQNFQMSGDVSDESAVGIGKMLGATIVIIGSTSDRGSEKLLTLRALDVKTTRVVSTARERY